MFFFEYLFVNNIYGMIFLIVVSCILELFNITETSKRARGCGRPCCRELALAAVHFRWLPPFRTVFGPFREFLGKRLAQNLRFSGNCLGFGLIRFS